MHLCLYCCYSQYLSLLRFFSMPCKMLKQAVFCCSADSPALLFAGTLQQLQMQSVKQTLSLTGAACSVPLSLWCEQKPKESHWDSLKTSSLTEISGPPGRWGRCVLRTNQYSQYKPGLPSPREQQNCSWTQEAWGFPSLIGGGLKAERWT